MSGQTETIKSVLKYVKSKKGQGLVGIAVVIAFCVAVGAAVRDAGMLDALNAIYSDTAQTAFAPPDIKPGETTVSGNVAAITGGGGGTSTSGSGGGGTSAGSNTGTEPGTTPPAGDTPPASDTPPAGDNPPAGNNPPAGDNPPAGGQDTPGMPGGGGQTGGGSSNTGSGNTFEQKKAALEAKMKASAVANGTAASYQLGAVVNDNGAYKIVINAGQGWNNLANYHIIDVNEALKASSDGKHISMNGGDIVIADDGNAYVNQYGHGWVSYPEDLYAQTSGCVKVKLN